LVPLWREIVFVHFPLSRKSIYIRTDTRIDAIAFGVIFAICSASYKSFLEQPVVSRIMLAIGIVILLGSYEFRNENFRIVFMYSVQGLSIVAILNYVIFANDAVAIATRRLLEANIAVYVGKISYVLYLWHLPVLFLLRDTYGKRFAVTFVAGLLSVALSLRHIVLWRSRFCNSGAASDHTPLRTVGETRCLTAEGGGPSTRHRRIGR
jgi:peptidoglycan/LPS O-acetylase OafA/YrhL